MRNIAIVHLTKDERELILDTMTGEQRDFLLTKLKRGRKNAFANGLIEKIGEELKSKHGNSLLFDNVDLDSETEWELVEIVDAGKRVDYLKCEGGLTLRYQYVVRQQGTGIEKKFGKRHFALHMGIPEHIAKAVINNISKIDMELDEILSKYQANELNYGYIEQLKDILPSFSIAMLMGIAIYPIKWLGMSEILALGLQVIVGAIVYTILAKVFK